MLYHPNPLFQEKSGYWQDTKLRQVRVEPRLLNKGNYRQRWIVLQKKGTGWEVVSSHISEFAAVIIGQRIANRLYKATAEWKLYLRGRYSPSYFQQRKKGTTPSPSPSPSPSTTELTPYSNVSPSSRARPQNRSRQRRLRAK